jgi:hypothetical protein
MNPIYYTYLLTFLGYPIIGFFLSKNLEFDSIKKYLILFLFIFPIHNVLFLLNYSLRGDYPDYLIFSLEYFFFCLTISLLYKLPNIYSKIFRVIGTVIIGIGILQGLLGILLFIVISSDFESDKIYNFNFKNSDYRTRRYSFGFATLIDTKFTFDTYKNYNYLPFEKQINKANLFESKSELDFSDDNFSIIMRDSSDKQILQFSSKNGKIFTVIID